MPCISGLPTCSATIALCTFALTCAPPPAASLAPEPTGAARHHSEGNLQLIHGVVLDEAGGLPHAGLHVVVGEQRTTTNSEGRFTLSGVPQIYDLVIFNEERSRVHVYQKLQRRDLLLTFSKRRDPATAAHHAQISGKLLGGGEYPAADALEVHFRGTLGTGREALGGTRSPDHGGPNFGPLQLGWDGATSFTGELFTQRRDLERRRAYCARSSLRVTESSHENVTLEFLEVPLVEREPVNFTAPGGTFGTPVVLDEYRAPGFGMALRGNEASGDHAYLVSDLQRCGLTLCTLGWIKNPYFSASAVACGAASTRAASLTLHEPPKFSQPAPKSRAAVGATFSWSPVADAVYALRLSVYSVSEKPSTAAPTIVVYSSEPAVVWPNLEALGVAFPQPFRVYRATVTGLGPYADLDRAVGPEGLGWGTPAEAWSSDSPPLSLFVEQLEESKCEYEQPAPIRCNEPGEPSETFRLARINDKLRHYPALANAIGLHCVQDCRAARAYTRAYATYLATHRGFDADEPLLEPEEEPPPPIP